MSYRYYPRRRSPVAISTGSLRMFNTYESAGLFEGRFSRLDDLILQHLQVQRELDKLNAYEECLCRMMAEGYTYEDVAEEIGVPVGAIYRLARRLDERRVG